MRILFIGLGGVGGTFAAKLAHQGVEVSAVARGKHLKSIQANGLRLKGLETISARVAAAESAKDLEPPNLIIFTTKLPDLAGAIKANAPYFPKGVPLLPLSNGIDAEPILEKHLPDHPILAGVAYVDSYIAEPGTIEVTGAGRIALGPWRNIDLSTAETIGTFLTNHGLVVSVTTEIATRKWTKLAYNSVFNPLCLLTRLPMGPLSKDPELKKIAADILAEARSVAKNEGVVIDADLVERFFADKNPQSAGNPLSRTSMWDDYKRGRPTEIDYLNGAIVARGRKYNLSTPINEAIVALVHALERARTDSIA